MKSLIQKTARDITTIYFYKHISESWQRRFYTTLQQPRFSKYAIA